LILGGGLKKGKHGSKTKRVVAWKNKVAKWRKEKILQLSFEQNKMDALTTRRLITAAYVYHVKMEDKAVQSFRGKGSPS